MKALSCLLVVAVSATATLALLSTPAGASDWNAKGEIAKLRVQMRDLTVKVNLLEAQLQTVQIGTAVAAHMPVPTAEMHVAPAMRTQSEIIGVHRRGMFMPVDR